jgi:NDP-sugar pyrophosphorylase family protein
MPLWSVPVLEHVFRLLRDWGVRDVLVNLHHLANQVQDYLRARPADGLRISLSFEPRILGTGGALRKADWFLDNFPFWLVNADIAADLRPRRFFRAYAQDRPVAALWMHPSRGPRTVEMRDGLIKDFASRRPGTTGTYTFCGLHLVSPAIRRYFPDRPAFSIIDAYRSAMRDGLAVRGVVVPNSYWRDLGTPDAYLRAHAEIRDAHRIRKPGARLYAHPRRARGSPPRKSGFVSIGAGFRTAGTATISDSVLWDDVSVRNGARIHNAIVGSGTVVRGIVDNPLVCWTSAGVPEAAPLLREAGWNPTRTTAEVLPARGSGRRFLRLRHTRASAILVLDDGTRRENARYAEHARFLARMGLPVPAVLAQTPHALLLEDLGRHTLTDLVRAGSPARIKRTYTEILEHIAQLHRAGARSAAGQGIRLEPGFSERVFRYERDLFVNRFLLGYTGCSEAEAHAVRRELAALARRLLQAKPVLLHRDLQSSNIFLVRGHPVFIDFQGMRLGPAVYDLASLLSDPYTELEEDLQTGLLDDYAARVPRAWRVHRFFWPAAVQRLTQALGAYARFCLSLETQRFQQFIPPALRLLASALQKVDGVPKTRAIIETLGN